VVTLKNLLYREQGVGGFCIRTSSMSMGIPNNTNRETTVNMVNTSRRPHKPPAPPLGQPTRGKTALNRLRQVDVFVALAYPHLLSAGAPLVIDVGYGAQAWTALEMADRWARLNPRLRLLGLEIDAARVAAAQPYVSHAPPIRDFRLGGFNVIEALGSSRARVIRAYNVLRQYEEAAVWPALAAMAQGLEPGGMLIEGTSTPSGRMVAFDVYRWGASGLAHEALVFGTTFREAVEPADFQTILPKRLIHHMRDEAPARFFGDWGQAFQRARGAGHLGWRQLWLDAVRRLREDAGYPLDPRRRLAERGFLVLRHSLLPMQIAGAR
jgi:hypothetical protein